MLFACGIISLDPFPMLEAVWILQEDRLPLLDAGSWPLVPVGILYVALQFLPLVHVPISDFLENTLERGTICDVHDAISRSRTLWLDQLKTMLTRGKFRVNQDYSSCATLVKNDQRPVPMDRTPPAEKAMEGESVERVTTAQLDLHIFYEVNLDKVSSQLK
jgi:hypothetical protein